MTYGVGEISTMGSPLGYIDSSNSYLDPVSSISSGYSSFGTSSLYENSNINNQMVLQNIDDKSENIIQWQDLSIVKLIIFTAIANVLENAIMYPFWSVKTRQQAASGGIRILNVVTCGKKNNIFQRLSHLYNGFFMYNIASFPSYFMFFMTYTWSKTAFGYQKDTNTDVSLKNHQQKDHLLGRIEQSSLFNPVTNFVKNISKNIKVVRKSFQPLIPLVSGVLAEATSLCLYIPVDIVVQRMQVPNNYDGFGHVVRELWKENGIKSFYSGFGATLMNAAVFSGVWWFAYENLKTVFETVDFENIVPHIQFPSVGSLFSPIVAYAHDSAKQILKPYQYSTFPTRQRQYRRSSVTSDRIMMKTSIPDLAHMSGGSTAMVMKGKKTTSLEEETLGRSTELESDTYRKDEQFHKWKPNDEYENLTSNKSTHTSALKKLKHFHLNFQNRERQKHQTFTQKTSASSAAILPNSSGSGAKNIMIIPSKLTQNTKEPNENEDLHLNTVQISTVGDSSAGRDRKLQPRAILVKNMPGMLAGFCGGGLAALASNPLDVVKTRIQTSSGGIDVSTGTGVRAVIKALSQLVKEEGVKGAFFRGIVPNFMATAPQGVVSSVCYESILVLSRKDHKIFPELTAFKKRRTQPKQVNRNGVESLPTEK